MAIHNDGHAATINHALPPQLPMMPQTSVVQVSTTPSSTGNTGVNAQLPSDLATLPRDVLAPAL